ncbi:MAG: TonB-dependent receptor [Bacteroidota bacterium]
MKAHCWPMILVLLCLGISPLHAQKTTLVQTVRGQVLDADSKVPLIGVNLILLGTDPLLGTTTDLDGRFKLENIPVGRINLEVSYLGYEPQLLSSLQLTSGKELILNVELVESTIAMEEVVVTAKHDKTQALNEMATVSARSFSVEETSRYAASMFDPARMAQNFAGVSTGGGFDLENEIIVRGNSPRGVLWRLEGIEIPNPNHFSALGGSGGAISMLSSSTLASSDFYTGAFPAEYGNAFSGVFDLNLRRGNNEKREYAFMVGLLGVEAAAEGPFQVGKDASYLVNYRYSTLSLLSDLGFKPAGDVFPTYQDLSFKVNLPTEKAGTFALFGLGGANRAYFDPPADSTQWGNTDNENWGFNEQQRVGTIGLSHRILLNDQGYLRTVIAASSNEYINNYYYLDANKDYEQVDDESSTFTNNTFRLSTLYNQKFNARNTLRVGLILSQLDFDFALKSFDEELEQFKTYFDNRGETQMYQVYAHWKFRANGDWTILAGVHYTMLALNNNYSLEPRISTKYRLAPKHSLSFAAGLHSKPEDISFYFLETTVPGQERTSPNRDLELMKAAHFVLGYDWMLSPSWRLKAELYYQYLYDVPVEKNAGSINSVINARSIWSVVGAGAANNDGTGRNYGVDLTLEKFFGNGYYFLLTGSLFESKYTPINGIEYSTRYNSNHQLNVLGGKEFQVGKKGNKTLGINAKAIWAGGNRYTPIDIEASREAGYTIRDESQPFSNTTEDYFRVDLGFNFRINTAKMTHTILLDIQNVTNRLNAFNLYYSPVTEQVETYTQVGLFPNLNYRIEF